jgi:glyceraldehyde 3-phosphate dehydrogenase
MTIKVAINGYGRIGRNVLRAFYEGGKKQDIEIVAINDLGKPESNAHLTRFDTTHGRFPGTVAVEGDYMIVNGDKIRVFAQRNPAEIPWAELGVDVVLECTGFFTTKEKASAHLKGGAKKVIISAPGGKDVDATIVYGVNQDVLKASDTVISNASCTTNCLAPLVKPLNDAIGLESGLMTTVHAYTNDQVLTDVMHEDLRRARSALDDPDQDRRRLRGRAGAAGTERQAGRLRNPRADHQRLDRRFVLHRQARHHRR